MTNLWPTIAQHIAQVTGDPGIVGSYRGVGGGSINQCYQLTLSSGQLYFVKCNQAKRLEMFEAERAGLEALAAAQAIRIPTAICTGIADETAYLVLEYIPLGIEQPKTGQQLGEQLAALHRIQKPQYGWDRPNTIGSTPQLNPWTDNWVRFYQQQRLDYQIRLARRQGFSAGWIRMAEQVIEELGAFFESYTPAASLLHGDLWAGNWGTDQKGDPVLFDPAVYYGDRETDLAMTELFGGFPEAFYRSYQQNYPLDPGYKMRKPLYQLYHLLNHLNLFGGSYRAGVEDALKACIRHLGS